MLFSGNGFGRLLRDGSFELSLLNYKCNDGNICNQLCICSLCQGMPTGGTVGQKTRRPLDPWSGNDAVRELPLDDDSHQRSDKSGEIGGCNSGKKATSRTRIYIRPTRGPAELEKFPGETSLELIATRTYWRWQVFS